MLIFNLIAIVLGLSFLLPFISSSRIAATILLGACRFVNSTSLTL